jgi:hypothetical protein
MVFAATAKAPTLMAHVDKRPHSVPAETHGRNVEDHGRIEGKASVSSRALLNRLDVRESD